MRKISALLLFFIMFHYFPAMAGFARAQWINSSQIILKLPPGLYVSNSSTQFYLADMTPSILQGPAHNLPLVSKNNNYVVLSTSHLNRETIDQLLTSHLKVVTTNASKLILDSTSIQLAGLLDELYYYSGNDLGGNCNPWKCVLKLWSPTAKNVRVVFANGETMVSQRDEQGVWSLTLPPSYKNQFYNYELQIYQPFTDKLEIVQVIDPYSKGLSKNSKMSQLLDVEDPQTKPLNWDNLNKPALDSINDSVIYELHIRDFSATDDSVASSRRGTYLAFTEQHSTGMKHLRALAHAGLSHVHLLPFNDFASINEDKTLWENYWSTNHPLQEPQSVIGGIRAEDPFNWGYDPVQYFTPEGSYAFDQNGPARVHEVREMIKALNESGLRVVQDVVFNHTYENGLTQFSVFDKIVPLYYYRLNDEGQVMSSSCCADTASEHLMMEKLMIDSVVYWAKTFKMDGFRFDLMSFHSRATMARLKDSLRSLTLEKDGVDGSKLLLYGEGWSFGSYYERFAKDAMTIENSAGTQFGFFNDRMRDAIRGGTTNSSEKSDQGFATGLFFDFNHEPANRNTSPDLSNQKDKILHLADVIKAGLAGNLREFYFREHFGNLIRSGDLRYRGAIVACANEAIETINYVSAHDGYTLWDAILAKAPFKTPGRVPATATSEDRQRMAQLALAIPLLSQGIPFIEGGIELLRSKNGDQDSYDSGDFFNRLEWSELTNHWGEGLPPAWKNIDDWSFWTPRLKDPMLQVHRKEISQVNEYFKGLLRLRKHSRAFRLNSISEVSKNLRFIDNDIQQEPGLIALLLQGPQETLMILFNASREARAFQNQYLHSTWSLHPLFDEKIDPVLQQVVLNPALSSVQIPGRTTVVLRALSPSRSPR